MDKRTQWIETEERETICIVLGDLLEEAAQQCPKANIDVDGLERLFDEPRDW